MIDEEARNQRIHPLITPLQLSLILFFCNSPIECLPTLLPPIGLPNINVSSDNLSLRPHPYLCFFIQFGSWFLLTNSRRAEKLEIHLDLPLPPKKKWKKTFLDSTSKSLGITLPFFCVHSGIELVCVVFFWKLCIPRKRIREKW